MAVVYNWIIENMEHEVSDGGVVTAYWRCNASEDVTSGDDTTTYTSTAYGSCGFTYDASSPDFTPYNDLTEAQVQGWVWEQVSQADTEAALAAEINVQKNPTSADGVPWETSTE